MIVETVSVAVGVIGKTRCGEVIEVVECVDGFALSIAVGGVLCSYHWYGLTTVGNVARQVVSDGVEVLEMWERVGRRCWEQLEKLRREGGLEIAMSE